MIRARDVDHAIELANMIDLGLGGCVFGDDHDELVSIAERVET